ncbi:acetyl-CoA carboxylase biotin carboxyl carrier protein subunit [Hungatella hathewayi]|nr:acetyl-CoA carboxylase biotin carboxyl carrier protein subunit [Hungatella hathewayi]
MRPPVTAEAVSQNRPAGGAGAAAVQKGAFAGTERITAPLQGTILSVPVTSGQTVKCGEVLVIIEAMKMENEIIAPRDCTVTSIITSKGAAVAAGDPLIEIS